MAIKNRVAQKNLPQLTTVHLVPDSDDISLTHREPSIDLVVVFDEKTHKYNGDLGNRAPVDISADLPQVKEHNYYKVLFESAIDGIFIIDAETMRIVLSNRTAAEMYGFDDAEDMLGVNSLKLVHPDDRDRAQRIIAQDIINENLRLIHRFRGVARDGKMMWLRVVGSRTDYKGKLAALISVRDISEQVEVEAGNQQAEQRLGFTSQLASVGELAAGIACQLNDPLSAVLAYDQLLIARKNLDEPIRSGLEAIYRETQRATTITDNLLLFGRRHKPEKILLSINEVIERAVELCGDQIKAGNIDLSLKLAPELPQIMADFDQMRQVFVNIISNAREAIAESQGAGDLCITSEQVEGVIRITFIDSGPGIAENDLPNIFDPFFTTHSAGKRTGLGLTICYGLVEAHDGRVFADSSLGAGTTLTVEIPVV